MLRYAVAATSKTLYYDVLLWRHGNIEITLLRQGYSKPRCYDVVCVCVCVLLCVFLFFFLLISLLLFLFNVYKRETH